MHGLGCMLPAVLEAAEVALLIAPTARETAQSAQWSPLGPVMHKAVQRKCESRYAELAQAAASATLAQL